MAQDFKRKVSPKTAKRMAEYKPQRPRKEPPQPKRRQLIFGDAEELGDVVFGKGRKK